MQGRCRPSSSFAWYTPRVRTPSSRRRSSMPTPRTRCPPLSHRLTESARGWVRDVGARRTRLGTGRVPWLTGGGLPVLLAQVGWQSGRFCEYPQELGFQFAGPVHLMQLQVLVCVFLLCSVVRQVEPADARPGCSQSVYWRPRLSLSRRYARALLLYVVFDVFVAVCHVDVRLPRLAPVAFPSAFSLCEVHGFKRKHRQAEALTPAH
jgi:hypothetical protein